MYIEKKFFQYFVLIFFAVVTAYSILVRASLYDEEGLSRLQNVPFRIMGENLAGDYGLFRLLEQKVPSQEAYQSEKISAFLNKNVHVDGTFFSFASPMKAFVFVPLLNAPYNSFFDAWLFLELFLFGAALYTLFALKKTLFLMFALPAVFLSFITGSWGVFIASAVIFALTLTEDYPKLAGFFGTLCIIEPIAFIFIAAVFLFRRQKEAATFCIGFGLLIVLFTLFRYDTAVFKYAIDSAWRTLTEKPCVFASFSTALNCGGMPLPLALVLHALLIAGIVFFGVKLFLRPSCPQAVQDAYLCAALCLISPFSFLGDYGLLYAGIAFLLRDSELRGRLKGDGLFLLAAFSSIYLEAFFMPLAGVSIQMFLSIVLLDISYRRSF